MKKRLLSILLIAAMLLTMLPVSALAQTNTASTATTAQDTNPFTDVKRSDWYYTAVQYARVNGFFGGVSKTLFAPGGTMTRGMFVTVLGRMAGVDPANYSGAPEFSDVAADAYYAPYVQWAAKYGITNGTGGGKFAPDRLISREEMVVFFVRYLELFGVELDTGADITTTPSDLEAVSSWARDAVLKLWKTGLLNGTGGRFDPKGDASRAQAAALCMRMDKGVDTWYSEPGVPSTRVSIDPADEVAQVEEVKRPSSGGGRSDGTTTTTYYAVTFALGDGMDAAGVTLPNAKTVASGTKISALPTPYVTKGLFAGWYYDAELTDPAGGSELITRDLTLYARLDRSEEAVQVTQVTSAESPNSVTDNVAAVAVDSYSFGISGYTGGCIEAFVNVTANNAEFTRTSDTDVQYRYTVSGGTVTPVLEEGQTYRVELTEDFEGCFVIGGVPQPQSVRVLYIITDKSEVDELRLDTGLKYIEKSQVSGLGALDGLFSAALSADGTTASIERVAQSGTFTYAGGGIAVGDTVAIYTGTRPDLRTEAEDDAIAYVEITGIDGTTYSYRTADAQDVLFTPDVLPVKAEYKGAGTASVPKSELDFTDDKYAAMGLSSQTSIDAGDFLLFYSGAFGESATSAGYGKITNVTVEGDDYVLTYDSATEDEVLAAMDVFTTREADVPELTQSQIAEMEADMVRQARESGFAEEAAQYLTDLAVQTDGFQKLSDDMGLTVYSAAYDDGTPVQQSAPALLSGSSAAILDKDNLKIEAKINAGSLTHFDGKYGLRAELTLSFTVEIERDSVPDGKLVIEVRATFEQEILLSVNTSGGAVWKKAWIFPYIADYQLNANLDLGLYTGIGIVATARTEKNEDDSDPLEGFEGTAIDLSKQIQKLMEDKEHFLGEDIDMNTVGGGLADKYSAMMEDAEENWIELFRKEIYSKEGPVDKFHILVYGISADFVVSVNLYVTLGMSFEYEAAKRYTFSLKLFSRSVTNGTAELVTPHYNFDFYVMGTMGVRAGVEFEIGIGLFSLKLDSIGITAEAGVYARMWGYFYYHLEWEKGKGKESSASGAMFVEIGVYLKITFKAQLFSSDKLTYQPTLYENEWPLWSAGAQKNVYDFAYDDDDESLNIEIMGVRTAALPSSLFDMNYMDMKTGEVYGSDADDADENPAQNYDDATESHYTVELDNPYFSYDPATNTITVTPDRTSVQESCKMTIRWKNGALTFTSKPIERTITIDWTDPENLRFIAFNTQGGSLVRMLALAADAPVEVPDSPVKTGYTFGGWYTEPNGGALFEFPATMPDYQDNGAGKGVTVYARWIPRDDTKYTVEHYQQKLNGTYALYETEYLEGTTDALTSAAARGYTGFRSKSFSQKAIAPDGSTVVKIYYAREKYNITFHLMDGASADESVVTIGRYGETVYAPKFARSGYEFDGYTGDGIEKDNNGNWCVTVRGGASYTAQWLPSRNIAYRVEHYVKRVGGEGYLLYDGEGAVEYRYDGTTGQEITAAALDAIVKLDAPGLHYDQAATEAKNVGLTIGADGKTILKIYYDRAGYSVCFRETDGTLIEETAYVHGAKVAEPNAPVKQGYTFAGWFTDTACENAYSFNTKLTGSLTLYAKWVASSNTAYTARYFLQNADGSYPEQPQTEALHGTTGAAAELSKTFAGYHADAEHDGTVKSGTIAADGSLVLTAYFARNTYKVTFQNGDETVSEQTLRWGEALTVPALTKAGYDLSWSPALPGTLTMPQQDVTYTAVWTAQSGIGYAVEHYQQNVTGSGYTLADTDRLTGTTDAEVTAAAKGYEHFTLNEETSTRTGTIKADGSLTLRLYYDRDTVELTLVPNGGRLDGSAEAVNKTLRYGAPLDDVTPVWDTDHAFAGWFTDTTYTTQVTTAPAAAATLYAKWSFGTVNYTVEHYVMGTDGQYPASATRRDTTKNGVVDSTVVLETLKDTTLEVANGITYAYATVGSDPEAVTETTVAGGKVVKLFYARRSFAVTFNANGGTLDETSRTLYYGASLSGITPTRKNYTFTGWYDTAAASGAAVTTLPAASGEGQTFYAGWRANEVAFTVEHWVQNTDGHGLTMVLSETKREPVGKRIAPADYESSEVAREDGGIYYASAYEKGHSTAVGVTLVEEGMTLELHYGRKKSQLKWVYDQGVSLGGATAGEVYFEEPITPLPLKREGYTYVWQPEVAEKVGLEDLTYTAVWTPNAYTVSFYANGGEGTMESQSLTYDTQAALSANAFTRAGYTFTGWNTARDGSGTAYVGGQTVQNLTAVNGGTITLYAQWSLDTYTITYLNTDGSAVNWVEGFTPVAEYTAEDDTITLPGASALVKRTGYEFGGWYSDGVLVTEISAGSAGNKTLRASWNAEKNEIVYVDETGLLSSVPEATPYTAGKTALDDKSRVNKDDTSNLFLYWYTKDADGTQTPVATVPENTKGRFTVYAKVISKTISTADQLKELAIAFEFDDGALPYYGKEDCIFTLANNITLTDWDTPIGPRDTTGTSYRFKGTFDGNDHRITLKGNCKPLFGVIGQYGTVKDLIIELDDVTTNVWSSNIKEEADNRYWGAVAAVNIGIIRDCTVTGTLTVADDSCTSYIGGIVGIEKGGNDTRGLIDCQAGMNEADRLTITGGGAKDSIGGLIGGMTNCWYNPKLQLPHAKQHYVTVDVDACKYAGGLVGSVQSDSWQAIITMYDGSLDVQLKGYILNAGGLVGYASTYARVYMENAALTVDIRLDERAQNNNYYYAGGVVGMMNGDATNVVQNSISAVGGSITTKITAAWKDPTDGVMNNMALYAGGLAGRIKEHAAVTVENGCNVSATITNQWSNTRLIIAYAGGLVGHYSCSKEGTLTVTGSSVTSNINIYSDGYTVCYAGGLVGVYEQLARSAVTKVPIKFENTTVNCTIKIMNVRAKKTIDLGGLIGNVISYKNVGIEITGTGNTLTGSLGLKNGENGSLTLNGSETVHAGKLFGRLQYQIYNAAWIVARINGITLDSDEKQKAEIEGSGWSTSDFNGPLYVFSSQGTFSSKPG